MATSAPFWASASADARPMPPDAPVTRATFPANFGAPSDAIPAPARLALGFRLALAAFFRRRQRIEDLDELLRRPHRDALLGDLNGEQVPLAPADPVHLVADGVRHL